MFKIGCHLSASKGFMSMARNALDIHANVFQFFTRNPRGGAAKAIDENDVAEFLDFTREHGITDFLAHAPYTLNACAAEPRIRTFALETMADDLRRMEYVPGNMYTFHPGSHVGQELPLESMPSQIPSIRYCAQNKPLLYCWKPCREKALKLVENSKSCQQSLTKSTSKKNLEFVWIPVMYMMQDMTLSIILMKYSLPLTVRLVSHACAPYI